MGRKVKICPNPECGYNNDYLADCCDNCPTSLENVPVVELDERPAQASVEEKSVPKEAVITEGAAETFRFSSATAELECINPTGMRFRLSGSCVLGRTAEINLTCLPESHAISRRHARVMSENGKWYIEDLNSANGTFVNGEKLSPNLRHEVVNGMRVAFANTNFIFRVAQ